MNKKISIIAILIVMIVSLIPIRSNAQMPIDSAYIYANRETDALLKWNDMGIYTHVAVYKKDGKEYPAYCMNRELPGVEVGFSQTVDVSSLINNVKVWRAIINGYPYKSVSELGCKTEDEAYLATKQAVYCMHTNRDVNEYSAIGEAGKRTLKALKQIVNAARNTSTSKVSSDLTINQKNSLWEIDNKDKNYVSQIFSVSADAPFSKYSVTLSNLDIEGVKITNKSNKEKKEFNSDEEFKVLIPITSITKDGDFKIKVSGKVETKPVLYGKSRDDSLQSYALTGYTYEDGTGSKKVYYTKNESKIIIIKKDETGKKFLEGVEFELLDNNKEVIYTELKTDNNGKVVIDNLTPGIYYVRETKTLEGYEIYDKLIKVELDLNEESTVNVVNQKEETKIEKKKTKSEQTIKNTKSKQEVKQKVKLPKTGM